MLVNSKHFIAIWLKEDDNSIVQIIDQRHLPHRFIIEDLKTVKDIATTIKDMHVRGAPLIGITAAYGMYLACLNSEENNFLESIIKSAELLRSTRPTAVNLMWAIDKQLEKINQAQTKQEAISISLSTAKLISEQEIQNCKQIGEFGSKLIEEISKKKNDGVVNILTHCNAGWLACGDYGTATAPIYAAFDKGIKIHVWVDETRPRNQGARLTAWELGQHGVAHTVIPDNTGGHLMQHGMVDIVIVGSDRTTYTGDVCNKIGTYLKALAAKDNNVPFYVALPSSTIDWEMKDGIKEIPIEQRDGEEVKYIQGLCEGEIKKVLLTPSMSNASNFAFDVTPSRLVKALITERGICSADSVLSLFPENKK